MYIREVRKKNGYFTVRLTVRGGGAQLDKAPRLSIRIDIWILLSDTETSAATPPGVMQKK